MCHSYSVSLENVIENNNLDIVYLPKSADEILITTAEVNRPGIVLTGYTDYFDPLRIQILGWTEFGFLINMNHEDRIKALGDWLSLKPAAAVVTRGLEIPDYFIDACKTYEVPLLKTQEETSPFLAALIAYLNKELAPRITRHGVLVEVYGEGVLITGESGVGKEAIPRLIHDNSLRKNKKYFAVNCGSIPEGTIDSELFGHEKGAFTGAVGEREGYFGAANGGTLFLDEVGELPLSTQARLLRVLETGEYIRVGSSEVRKTDVRIVAATNVNMAQAIKEGKFREDLYYRLNTIPIKMLALRERPDDIVLLFKKFAMDTAEKYNMPEPVELSEEAKIRMKAYPWPGNVRQLKNVTEQISILSRERYITPEILAEYVPEQPVSHDLIQLNASGKEQHSFENEREILYKILFDLRNDVTELKKLVHSQQSANPSVVTNSSVPAVPMQNPAPYYGTGVAYPQDHPASSVVPAQVKVVSAGKPVHEDEDIQTPEEYVEESLSLDDWERQMIIKALEKNGGRRKGAAHDLNISERTLYRKIKEYGLEK